MKLAPLLLLLVSCAARSDATPTDLPDLSLATSASPGFRSASAPAASSAVPSAVASSTAAPPEEVPSCASAGLAPTGAGKAAACNEDGGAVAISRWQLEGEGKARRATGIVDRWEHGTHSLHAPVSTDDPTVVRALETADSAGIDVLAEDGLLWITTTVSVGEDYRTTTSIMTLFLDPSSDMIWAGLGTRSESMMDTCTKLSLVTFRLFDSTTIERQTASTAIFTPQNLDPALLARLKKECVAPKPAQKIEKLKLGTH